MLTTIPFAGFYQTHHDAELDDALDQMFSDHASGTQIRDDLRERAFDKVQWAVVHANYAAEYTRALAAEFELKVTFKELWSPKEYNFETDRIYCEIDLEEVKRLWLVTSTPIIRNLARERFTHREGFISFYSPDIDEWGTLDTWDMNQVGTLVEAYIEMMSDAAFDYDAELDLMESARTNGRYDSWISATTEVARLANIHDYLQARMERKRK